MNQFKTAPALLVATCMMFLTSCGNDQQKSEAATTDSTASTTNTTSSNASSKTDIDTTPQTMLLVRHKVANYAKWKMSYDSHDSFRIANGIHNYVISRGVEDSNMLLVATKADDVAKAKAFAKDPNLK